MQKPTVERKALPRPAATRIMEFARVACHHAIVKGESELARHLMMIGQASIHPATYESVPLVETRDEALARIKHDLSRNHTLYAIILAELKQLRDAEAEETGKGIADAVMANRRAEATAKRKADDDSKTVGDGK